MTKARKVDEDTMRSFYDFSNGIKNPFAHRFAKGSNLVMIRPELFRTFPSEEAVNDALATLVNAGATTRAVKAAPDATAKLKASMKRPAQSRSAKAS